MVLSTEKKQPIQEIKKIEKAQTFLKREDGSYDFLASKEDMDWYEEAFLKRNFTNGITYWIKRIRQVLDVQAQYFSLVCGRR